MFEDDVWLIELAVPLHDNGRIAILTPSFEAAPPAEEETSDDVPTLDRRRAVQP